MGIVQQLQLSGLTPISPVKNMGKTWENYGTLGLDQWGGMEYVLQFQTNLSAIGAGNTKKLQRGS